MYHWFFCLFVMRPYWFHLPLKVDGFPRPRDVTARALSFSSRVIFHLCHLTRWPISVIPLAPARAVDHSSPMATAAARTAPPPSQLRVVSFTADPSLGGATAELQRPR